MLLNTLISTQSRTHFNLIVCRSTELNRTLPPAYRLNRATAEEGAYILFKFNKFYSDQMICYSKSIPRGGLFLFYIWLSRRQYPCSRKSNKATSSFRKLCPTSRLNVRTFYATMMCVYMYEYTAADAKSIWEYALMPSAKYLPLY